MQLVMNEFNLLFQPAPHTEHHFSKAKNILSNLSLRPTYAASLTINNKAFL